MRAPIRSSLHLCPSRGITNSVLITRSLLRPLLQECAVKLDQRIVSQMYKDCLMWEGESQADLDDFIKNIIAICEQKGASVQIEGGECGKFYVIYLACV